jgi:hypothetical protein
LKICFAWPALLLFVFARAASAQPAANKWEITDNSFLIEEAFNQERDVFQNIFVWTRGPQGTWQASFTQEWPAPNISHQFSYTIPFSGSSAAAGIGDVQLNYRYQLFSEAPYRPAVAPRFSVILPSGRESDRLGAGATSWQFNVPASMQFGNFYVHVNAGATHLHDDWTSVAGVSVIWRMVPMGNLMFETIGEPGHFMTWSPGFRYGWNLHGGQLVVGAGVPITHTTGREATAAVLTYFSYEPRFR